MKLAEKADLSVGYICDLESGRRWETPETFSKLSCALGINPFELLLPSVQESASISNLSELRDYIATISDSLKQNVTSAVNKAISETLEMQLTNNK
ncbi:MAG: helix-turn-helix transcriptional regulator [Treponema sp.]|nr:helix-turn-helix transcriptional regulator [Treponema sp.]